jgi:hypothetical protein
VVTPESLLDSSSPARIYTGFGGPNASIRLKEAVEKA